MMQVSSAKWFVVVDFREIPHVTSSLRESKPFIDTLFKLRLDKTDFIIF